VFECVINISEGTDLNIISAIAVSADTSLCDVHIDPIHNRSVLTLVGEDVLEAVKRVTKAAVDLIDITTHTGLHPRFGAADVIPFIPFTPGSIAKEDLAAAKGYRDDFIRWAGRTLGLPCISYGPERSLPEVRKLLKNSASQMTGHKTAGITSVGARQLLLAYNLYIGKGDGQRAVAGANEIRSSSVRSLGFCLNGEEQVSCNLIDLENSGPLDVYNELSQSYDVQKTELVGLIPLGLLQTIDRNCWEKLDLSYEKTVEYRLSLSDKERSEKALLALV